MRTYCNYFRQKTTNITKHNIMYMTDCNYKYKINVYIVQESHYYTTMKKELQ